MNYYYTALDPATNKPITTGVVNAPDEIRAKSEIQNAIRKSRALGTRRFIDVRFVGNSGLATWRFTVRAER